MIGFWICELSVAAQKAAFAVIDNIRRLTQVCCALLVAQPSAAMKFNRKLVPFFSALLYLYLYLCRVEHRKF